MFGQQQPGDEQYQQQPMSQPADPAADGTLGVPMIDPGDPMQQISASTDSAMPPFEPTDTGIDTASSRDMQANTPEELIGIKQEALQSLKPLLGHLQQSPEEKFRTTMMMIQAADDQSLIPDAYDAARNIADDKTRAQALLDVVNEINYFTTQSQKSGE